MKLGVIGCGNMAQAMVRGIVETAVLPAGEIMISNPHKEKLVKIKEQLGVVTTLDNCEVVHNCGMIILAVKPMYYPKVIEEIRGDLRQDAVIISIAPGLSIEKLEGMFENSVKLVRTMPNTPAMVGEGMTGMCCNEYVSPQEEDRVVRLLEGFGRVESVTESMMDAVVAVSGSSPAYVYMFIEAMADAAVMEGMPRDKAYQFAAQAVLGSAKMVLDTGMHPGKLKDMVCSPSGTTIEAVRVLEERGFRSAVIEAMTACWHKAKGD